MKNQKTDKTCESEDFFEGWLTVETKCRKCGGLVTAKISPILGEESECEIVEIDIKHICEKIKNKL
jgi:hypothetical protein